MKRFIQYINEAIKDIDDFWYIEEFCDEDTGEIVPIVRRKDSPQILAFLKKAKAEEDKIVTKIDELTDKLYSLSYSSDTDDMIDEINSLLSDREDAKRMYNMLSKDMEEEAGEWWNAHNNERDNKEYDREFDKFMNEYGGKMQKYADEIEALDIKIDKLKDKLNKKMASMDADIKSKEADINKQIEALEKELEDKREANRAKYDKMTKDFEKEHPIPKEYR